MRTDETRAARAAAERKRHQERREFGISHLGGICVSCGATENLQFDHIDASTKSFAVSEGMRRFDAWLKEIEKCQLLCHPCHINKTIQNEETPQQRKFGSLRHGTYTMYGKGKCRCEDCRLAYSNWKKAYRRR